MGERTRDGVDKVSQWQLPKSSFVKLRTLQELMEEPQSCASGFLPWPGTDGWAPITGSYAEALPTWLRDKQHMILGYRAIIPNKHKRTPNFEWLRSPSTSPDPLDSQFQCLFCAEFLGLRISEDFPLCGIFLCRRVFCSLLFLVMQTFLNNADHTLKSESLTPARKFS